MDEAMKAQQMDPAPAAKAGSEKPATTWKGTTHEDSDDGEFIGNFDEMEFVTLKGSKKVGSHAPAPASFSTREAYTKLAAEGLVDLPPEEGFMLSHHNQTCQWHARFGPGNMNFAPSWGAKRTEEEALLKAVEQLWKWFLQFHPDNVDGIAYLDRIQLKIQSLT